jgi:hypothetical protein
MSHRVVFLSNYAPTRLYGATAALHESSSPLSDPDTRDVNTSWTCLPVQSLRWVSNGSGLGITVAKRNICIFHAGDRTLFLRLASGHTHVPVGKVGPRL